MTRACQRCGATREASRFCPSCGLDFWQAAAGTQAPAPAPTPQAGDGRGGGASLGLVAVGAGLALLLVAGGLWFVLGMPATRGGPARVLVEPPAAHPLVLAFFSEARDPDAAFAWEQEAEVQVTGFGETTTSTLVATGRFDADDWLATMTIVDDGVETFSGELAVIGNHVFRREGEEGWAEGQRVPSAALAPMNPFARITTVGELEYVGPGRRNGVEGHILRTEKWLNDPEADDPIRRIAHVTAREALMEIHADDAGVPLSAVYTFSIEARTPDGEDVVLSGRTTYTFHDWGAVEPIAPPTDASPRPSGS